MKRIMTTLMMILASNLALADFVGDLTITNIRVKADGMLQFGVDPLAANTCDYFGYHLSLDTKTEAGKSVLSLLLAAKVSNKKINVWYAASTAPGTNETDGCTESNLSVINAIGIK